MILYSEKWGATYRDECDMWLEPKCGCTQEENKRLGMLVCWFGCLKRPDHPSQEPNLDAEKVSGTTVYKHKCKKG